MKKGLHRENLLVSWPDLSAFPETDAAYLAGIIDGEGWIGVMTKIYKSRFEVGVGTVSVELLDWICERFPDLPVTARKLIPKSSGEGYRKQGYEIHWRGAKRVVALLLFTLPYLTIKRLKAIEAVQELDTLYELRDGMPPFLLSRIRPFLPDSHAYPSRETGLSLHLLE